MSESAAVIWDLGLSKAHCKSQLENMELNIRFRRDFWNFGTQPIELENGADRSVLQVSLQENAALVITENTMGSLVTSSLQVLYPWMQRYDFAQ